MAWGMATAAGLTRADLAACVRWMRSRVGPIYQTWDSGILTIDDEMLVPSFRRVLKLLDGSDADVRRIDIDSWAAKEVRPLFAMYRRLRIAERRMAAEARRERMEG